MSKQSFCEREQNYLKKMNRFQLSNKFKKIGYIVAIIAFILIFVRKSVDAPIWVHSALLNIVLVGLLIVSISKEKIEDEFIDSLRSQSYRLAFLMVVVYSLTQPFINYIVGIFLNQNESLESFSYFQVLFFMLVIQLMFFSQLKRFNK
ncbi:hypothetical protein LPB136_03670 [Tenacibaculum todarodis]|uniref:Uncharacterized protein n=2 Tax=Tenacibaculum todarodis TaxID=1850252 RepID=A0A1L3JHC3_9FLAO|nr:hypothetical protein LPB136_03670 [Tenacibaculum todarodis]